MSPTTSKQGVTVRRSIITDSGIDPNVEFKIGSIHEVPVAVRIRDALPADRSPTDLYLNDDIGQWQSAGKWLELSAVIGPEDTVRVGYSVPGIDSSQLQFDDDHPVIDAVQPVDPEDGENGDVPLWRSSTSATIPVGTNDNATSNAEITVGTHADDADPSSSPFVPSNSEVTPTLSVIMPTLNEEEGIADCIDAIERTVEHLGVTAEVIVSDSSTDQTPEIARERGAIVVEPDKNGYGYAYQYAFRHARGEYIAIGDADTTYDFEDLPRLISPIVRGDADIVMGSRFRGTIESGSMPPLHQYVGNPLLTKFLNVFYGAGVTDAHSGLRILSRDALETLELRSNGMEFASEMVMDAAAKGLRIDEVPISYRRRKGEATLSSFRDGWRHVRFMLENAPSYLFSVPAIAFWLLGIALLLISATEDVISGVTFGVHTAIGGSLLVIVGYQISSLAVFSSVVAAPIRKQGDPITKYLKRHFTLEYGATIGVLLTIIGGSYTMYLLGTWIASNFTLRPFTALDAIAFTLIVLGVETVFYSFFLSMLRAYDDGQQ